MKGSMFAGVCLAAGIAILSEILLPSAGDCAKSKFAGNKETEKEKEEE